MSLNIMIIYVYTYDIQLMISAMSFTLLSALINN